MINFGAQLTESSHKHKKHGKENHNGNQIHERPKRPPCLRDDGEEAKGCNEYCCQYIETCDSFFVPFMTINNGFKMLRKVDDDE